MRVKIGFALCALALAMLLPGRSLSASRPHSPAQTTCCTLQEKEACMVAREIPECFDGVCRCVPRA